MEGNVERWFRSPFTRGLPEKSCLVPLQVLTLTFSPSLCLHLYLLASTHTLTLGENSVVCTCTYVLYTYIFGYLDYSCSFFCAVPSVGFSDIYFSLALMCKCKSPHRDCEPWASKIEIHNMWFDRSSWLRTEKMAISSSVCWMPTGSFALHLLMHIWAIKTGGASEHGAMNFVWYVPTPQKKNIC